MNRYIKITAIFVTALWAMLLPARAMAQSDALFSQYWALPSYYNPAAAGNSDSIKIKNKTMRKKLKIQKHKERPNKL